ncbi:kinase-like protein [Gymnopus androsaceus JB14]|uniref:Kinase-like protein n=1 Tax=Gymnopus androsaceus JB14 TaxID=1447944 RepID=A0A6A4IEQ7_9AGAR|nr:kinase-like protein [Gymnopus androsaceus JB14]
MRFLQSLPHTNLISPEQFLLCHGWYYIILPQHTTLLDRCIGADVGPMFPLARGLISGLSFLHQHDIVHLDLNPANIVCTPENELKIIDFNLSLRVKKGQKIFGVRGTEGWMAPGLYLVHTCIDGYLIFDFIEVK